MGNIEDPHVELGGEFPEQVEDAGPHRYVEHRHRLVGDQEARLDRDRARDGDALELAAAQLVRIAAGEVLHRQQAGALQRAMHHRLVA